MALIRSLRSSWGRRRSPLPLLLCDVAFDADLVKPKAKRSRETAEPPSPVAGAFPALVFPATTWNAPATPMEWLVSHSPVLLSPSCEGGAPLLTLAAAAPVASPRHWPVHPWLPCTTAPSLPRPTPSPRCLLAADPEATPPYPLPPPPRQYAPTCEVLAAIHTAPRRLGCFRAVGCPTWAYL